MATRPGFLPSRHFVLIALSVAIAVSLAIFAKTIAGQKPNPDFAKVVYTTTPNNPEFFEEKDSDNDGLKDWEEALWGTDPKKNDTDGDGTKDSVEISLENNSGDKKITSREKELTATDRISRDIFAQYVHLRGAGDTLEPEKISAFASSLAESANQYTETFPAHSYNDVLVIPENTAKSFQAYGNSLGAILKKNSAGLESELAVFSRVIQTQDPSELKKIGPIAEGYIRSAEALLRTPTPSQLRSLHLDIVNGLLRVGHEIRAFGQIESDPLSAFIALEAYRKDSAAIDDAFLSLRVFFENQNIVFGKNESGYILVQ